MKKSTHLLHVANIVACLATLTNSQCLKDKFVSLMMDAAHADVMEFRGDLKGGITMQLISIIREYVNESKFEGTKMSLRDLILYIKHY